ncbi:MAG: YdcF family protein [Rhodospirillales bacterium]|nr:YdcF family protein [Rhodospirillales bacterium]
MSLGPLPTALLLPPGNLLIGGIAAVVLPWPRRARRLIRWLGRVALVLVLVLALPFVPTLMTMALQSRLPLKPPIADPPQAIVILSAEVRASAPGALEPAASAGPMTLSRVEAGVRLARRTGLPILVTGGVVLPGTPPVGEVMARLLRTSFGLTARWVESRSENTWQNAAYSAPLLRAAGIHAIYLVTDAGHMPRAIIAFRHAGIVATAAPVRLARLPHDFPSLGSLIPNPASLARSELEIHEAVGLLYYWLRDRW